MTRSKVEYNRALGELPNRVALEEFTFITVLGRGKLKVEF